MKKMTATMLLIFAFIGSAASQQIDKIFDKYMEDERFQYIYNGSDTGEMNEKGLKNNGQRMLMLSAADADLIQSFTDEVLEAVKADGYKNTTYVRHNKNKVQGYMKITAERKDEVTLIQKGNEHVVLIWESYTTALRKPHLSKIFIYKSLYYNMFLFSGTKKKICQRLFGDSYTK